MTTTKCTMAQALIQYLARQQVERDGARAKFFGGCWGIFGHGNVAGVGQALHQTPEFPYFQGRNEQAMVHAAAGYARQNNRLRAMACTTSIGPGATNLITGAAGATINRLPVLLLPGDIFARRNVAPVLQQLESESSQDVSVNDCFRPISRYWDRIYRPEQLITSLPEAMRVLTSQSDTGAVTLCLPQDVQTEAYDYPAEFFEDRVWTISRPRADAALLAKAAEMIRAAENPIIVAGGGVIYSEATEILAQFAAQTGIAVVETQAGKGALHFEHECALGAMGVTGTPGANTLARDADLVVGIGTRYSDFTTASKTAFQNPDVSFINVNVASFDAFKHGALPLVADARAVLEDLGKALEGHRVAPAYGERIRADQARWSQEVQNIYTKEHGPPISQGEVIGVVNSLSDNRDVLVCAAGSLPGDLHKLWCSRDPKSYHVEYGYSCMGYEVAGGLGVKMAAPDRDVIVMVGDASYLMMAQELVTAVQEGIKLIVLILDNHGYSSIGGLSESVGSAGFGTEYRTRGDDGQLSGTHLPVDYVANAASMGVTTLRVTHREELSRAFLQAKASPTSTVIVVETDREARVGGYESWWDVPVAEVSKQPAVQEARRAFEAAKKKERHHL